MKKLPLFRKIPTIVLVLVLMLTISISCKKKVDENPTPSPEPGPLPIPDYPAVFTDRPLHMMTEYETKNHLPFIGHTLRAIGKGIKGEDSPEIPESFKLLGKTLQDVHDYEKKKKDFTNNYNTQTKLSKQISSLQSQVSALGTEIAIQTIQLESYFSTLEISSCMTNILIQMDSANINEYLYYPCIAGRYQRDSTYWKATMKDAAARTLGYADTTFNNTTNTGMQYTYKQLNNLMSGTSSAGMQNALHPFNKCLIVQAHNAGIYNDSAKVMKAYQILENYFLWIVGAQYQCENIMINCANVLDSTGVLHYAQSEYSAFSVVIENEVNQFLSEVDFFVANLDDYRSEARWSNDVIYAGSGLAPDNIFLNVLARAQLLANSIYSSFGANYPVMCGRIIVPSIYSAGDLSKVPPLTLNFSTKSMTSNAVPQNSWIPFTYWSGQNMPNTCSFDTTWAVYDFGIMGQPDLGWSAGQNSVTLECSDHNHPWTHSANSIGGNVSIAYYNPQDLNDKSSKYDSVHCMQYGFFSYNWKWGFLYLRYGTGWFGTDISTPALLWDYTCSSDLNLLPCSGTGHFNAVAPYVCTMNYDVQVYRCCTASNHQQYFSFNNDIGISQMVYNGTSVTSTISGSSDYLANWEWHFSATNQVGSNPICFAWQVKSMFTNGNGSNNVKFNNSGGTGFKKPSCSSSSLNINNGSVFFFQTTAPNKWVEKSGFGSSSFSKDQNQSFNLGFELEEDYTTQQNNFQILMYPNVAVVFTGMAGVPN